jgi:hypothetical protein
MSIIIEVKRAEATTVAGVSKQTQKPYSFQKQKAWAYLFDRNGNPDEFPTSIEIMLDDGAKPYPPGRYTLAPSSFYSGSFGSLALAVRLTPAAK